MGLKNGTSAVMFCSQEPGRAGYLELLLDYGADPNLTLRPDGVAPVHLAANFGNWSSLRLLIHAGADFEAKDKSGSRPMDYARQTPHADCIAVLLTAENKYGLRFTDMYDLDAADEVRTVCSDSRRVLCRVMRRNYCLVSPCRFESCLLSFSSFPSFLLIPLCSPVIASFLLSPLSLISSFPFPFFPFF